MQLEKSLTSLIAACRNTEQAYNYASTALIDLPEIGHFMEEQAQARELAVKALEDTLSRLGKRPDTALLNSPPSEGWTQPGPEDSSPAAIISACHRAEERAVEVYARILPTLPDEFRWEVGEQYASMRSALTRLHAWLRDNQENPELR